MLLGRENAGMNECHPCWYTNVGYVDPFTWVGDLMTMNDRAGVDANGLIQVFTVISIARRKPKDKRGLHEMN